MAEEDEFNALSKELESIKESLRTNTIQLRQMVEELSGVLPLMDIPRNLGEKIEEIRFRLAEPQDVCENATDTKFQDDGGLPFVEEAARKSQELTEGFGSRKLSDVVSEASKRSKELAAEASKKSKELAAKASKMSKEFTTEALKRADQITTQIPPTSVVLTNLVDSGQKGGNDVADLEKFGVTEELREFVKGITTSTFRDFPLEGDSEVSDIPTVSNVRQDLTEWQERHAKLVLSTVKEISKLRYQLCPRGMKERKFWRIYFILVNNYVAPYKKLYMEDVRLKATEKAKDDTSSVLGRFWEDFWSLEGNVLSTSWQGIRK
ncbi:hypothetical protein CDL12_27106 [Handroanthus impetiginosus]|uniref:BSD domain-containing protein n=1 Tax=Handroanthus impetiginosus TaxID=429701 RepID=A0A2G9G509_9LAMI|nr:hypothetical protein CDL12_27106 [Handroanthus impetiginosus]